MANNIIETDTDVKELILDTKQNSREEFIGFMRERKKLMDEKGKAQAEAELKVKYKSKIDKIKQKNK